MSHRIIRGLFLAGEDSGPKAFTSIKRRPRGAKGLGVKFEKELAKKLPLARHGQWFKFMDSNGVGYAQTDILFFSDEAVFCIEVKLGNVPAGRAQFLELYKPILEHVYERPARGIVVARYVSEDPEPKLIVHSLYDAIRASLTRVPTLQWRERLPLVLPPGLGPQPRSAACIARVCA